MVGINVVDEKTIIRKVSTTVVASCVFKGLDVLCGFHVHGGGCKVIHGLIRMNLIEVQNAQGTGIKS